MASKSNGISAKSFRLINSGRRRFQKYRQSTFKSLEEINSKFKKPNAVCIPKWLLWINGWQFIFLSAKIKLAYGPVAFFMEGCNSWNACLAAAFRKGKVKKYRLNVSMRLVMSLNSGSNASMALHAKNGLAPPLDLLMAKAVAWRRWWKSSFAIIETAAP